MKSKEIMKSIGKKIGKVLFCCGAAMLAAVCMPGTAKADYTAFGESVDAAMRNNGTFYGMGGSFTGGKYRDYQIQEDGYIVVRVTQPKDMEGNYIGDDAGPWISLGISNGSELEVAKALHFMGDDHYLDFSVGVQAGEIIRVEFYNTTYPSGGRGAVIWKDADWTYSVSFVREDYCEHMDDKGEAFQGTDSFEAKYSITGTQYPMSIGSLGTMYKGFLHGRSGATVKYAYPNDKNVDDIDMYEVILPANVDATIYIDGLDTMMKAAQRDTFVTRIGVPHASSEMSYEKIQDKFSYDEAADRYYYTFKPSTGGIYSIQLAGLFGYNYNVPYAVGVSYEGAGWVNLDGKEYWYENGVRQGTEGRGKEIYDPASDAWYWLDAVQDGAKAVGKDVYQESSGGKWVRYDDNGGMIKGWNQTEYGKYYFEPVTGAMCKGLQEIDGKRYYFDETTGCTYSGWVAMEGKDYWFEDGLLQGYDANNPSYRGKEIYDPGTDAWYWLDSVQGGAKAVGKDVYQESSGGKWVRYDTEGHMVKGWQRTDAGTYYFDLITGAMQKGNVMIDGKTYRFDENTGILQ